MLTCKEVSLLTTELLFFFELLYILFICPLLITCSFLYSICQNTLISWLFLDAKIVPNMSTYKISPMFILCIPIIFFVLLCFPSQSDIPMRYYLFHYYISIWFFIYLWAFYSLPLLSLSFCIFKNQYHTVLITEVL